MRHFVAILLFAVGVLAAGAPGASAQVVPKSEAEITFSFAPVVKQVAPAVVNIYTRKVVESRAASPFFNDPFFQQFFGGQFDFGIPQQRVLSSLGSGVIVGADGLIVTNNHVIQDSDQITVVLNDRREFPAKVVTADERIDLALLRIDTGGMKLPTLPLADSDQLQVGDLVLAIGDPFGVGQTVTSGIISALARTQVGISDYGFFIQTDAAINPGNSGGPLVTMDGKVAGINSAIFSKTGGSVGIGFAIPANMVAAFLAAEKTGGHLERAWIGVRGESVGVDMAEGLGLSHPTGVVVDEIYPDGPAARAGLQQGDVILAVNGKEVDDEGSLQFRLATLAAGGQASLSVQRGKQQMTLPVRPVPPPETPPAQRTELAGAEPLAGATIANLSPAVADLLQLADVWHGVVIVKIQRSGYAYRLGLARGDIIEAVNGQHTASVNDVQDALNAANGTWEITFNRDGQSRTIQIQ
ncbi:MAG TPA: Do family serine endopeptidase [Candidatus Udaeobacter sp.]|nr:Do family serine endopeptidase [Candidatus Udaeobacter sp.]